MWTETPNTNRVFLHGDKDFRSVIPHQRVLGRVSNRRIKQLQRLLDVPVPLANLINTNIHGE